jgi:hypothetical protein
MARPSHPPRLDFSNYTWRRVQITKLLIMYFSIIIIIIIINTALRHSTQHRKLGSTLTTELTKQQNSSFIPFERVSLETVVSAVFRIQQRWSEREAFKHELTMTARNQAIRIPGNQQ